MPWRLQIANRAQKELERLPASDQRRIIAALESMQNHPFGSDLARLKAERTTWRRRVGNYRIFFDLHPAQRVIDVVEIIRRTLTTY